MFNISLGITLVIEDIALVSADEPTLRSTRDLILVNEGAKLEIKGHTVLTNRFMGRPQTGTGLTGNSAVRIEGKGAQVIMFSGTINGNSNHAVRFRWNSSDSTFIMNDGLITRNEGHGVLLEGKRNIFTMNGGTISHHETGNRTGVRFGAPNLADNPGAACYPCKPSCDLEDAICIASIGNSFIMRGGNIINNDFGIRVVITTNRIPEYTQDCSFIMTGGFISNSTRHQIQVAGAPGFEFSKTGNSTIAATSTARIQFRDMTAGDIADYRDLAGPGLDLKIRIDPNDGNRYVPGSDDGTAANWRLLRPQ
jgi:hypothetical protein